MTSGDPARFLGSVARTAANAAIKRSTGGTPARTPIRTCPGGLDCDATPHPHAEHSEQADEPSPPRSTSGRHRPTVNRRDGGDGYVPLSGALLAGRAAPHAVLARRCRPLPARDTHRAARAHETSLQHTQFTDREETPGSTSRQCRAGWDDNSTGTGAPGPGSSSKTGLRSTTWVTSSHSGWPTRASAALNPPRPNHSTYVANAGTGSSYIDHLSLQGAGTQVKPPPAAAPELQPTVEGATSPHQGQPSQSEQPANSESITRQHSDATGGA